MPTTQTVLFPPPTRSNAVDDKGYLAIPLRQWLFSVQNLLPLRLADTSKGSYSESLPAAGLNPPYTGQSNQNAEIIYIKSSADANTFAVKGAINGTVTLTAQYQLARFKSDGTNWWNVTGQSGGSTLTLEVNGTPNADQALLNLFAGSGITLTDAGAGKVIIAAAGSGVVSGANVILLGPQAFFASNHATAGNTHWLFLPGSMLAALPASWKITTPTAPTGGVVGVLAAKVLRTLTGSLAVIDATAIRWSGSLTPSFASGSSNVSDAIALALDTAHDYYVAMYTDGAQTGNLWQAGAVTNPSLDSTLWGWSSGDGTALTTIPAFSTSFGPPMCATLAQAA